MRFIKNNFNKDIRFLISIIPINNNLSGTDACPHHIDRIYDCYDCIYNFIDNNCEGLCLARMKYGNFDFKYNEQCPHLILSEYGKTWNKKTGERF